MNAVKRYNIKVLGRTFSLEKRCCWMTSSSSTHFLFFFFFLFLSRVHWTTWARNSLDSYQRWKPFYPPDSFFFLYLSHVDTFSVHLSVHSISPGEIHLGRKGLKIHSSYCKDSRSLRVTPPQKKKNQMGRSRRWLPPVRDPGQVWLMDGRKLSRELATNIKRELYRDVFGWEVKGTLGNLMHPRLRIGGKKRSKTPSPSPLPPPPWPPSGY